MPCPKPLAWVCWCVLSLVCAVGRVVSAAVYDLTLFALKAMLALTGLALLASTLTSDQCFLANLGFATCPPPGSA